jgi:ubiquinone/menaquinone biosynthesis C-methylase UbiE
MGFKKLKKYFGAKTVSLLYQRQDLLQKLLIEIVQRDPSIVDKFSPQQKDLSLYIQKKSQHQYEPTAELPLPPKHLWEGYGNEIETYLEWGNQHITNMRKILDADGFQFQPGQRIMELGCAAARMLRWFAAEAQHSEIWGTDISSEHIVWCQQHLSPPFNFFTNTTAAHLPFADSYFDLIYAGSVFTHISELTDFWLLELRRVLKPNGRLYITVHDNNTIHLLKHVEPHSLTVLAELFRSIDAQKDITANDFEMFSINSSPRGAGITQVFYDGDYFKQKLAKFYAIKSINKEAYGYQTAILLEKP